MSNEARSLARLMVQRYEADPTWRWSHWETFVHNNIAEIRSRALPGHLGISLRHTSLGRPTILLDTSLSGGRRLFTLAHEIGHVSMAWHARSVTCGSADLSETAVGEEREANAFAAELLAPKPWVTKLVADLGETAALESAYRLLSASATTINLQMVRYMEPGWAFVQLGERNEVLFVGRSLGTNAALPNQGSTWHPEDELGSIEVLEFQHNATSHTYWIRFPTSTPLRPSTQSAAQLLSRISSSLALPEKEQHHLVQSLNGICGAAKNHITAQTTAEEVAALLWQRIGSRTKLRPMIDHPDFETFISQKARELRAG